MPDMLKVNLIIPVELMTAENGDPMPDDRAADAEIHLLEILTNAGWKFTQTDDDEGANPYGPTNMKVFTVELNSLSALNELTNKLQSHPNVQCRITERLSSQKQTALLLAQQRAFNKAKEKALLLGNLGTIKIGKLIEYREVSPLSVVLPNALEQYRYENAMGGRWNYYEEPDILPFEIVAQTVTLRFAIQ
jgi:hypothetical protein